MRLTSKMKRNRWQVVFCTATCALMYVYFSNGILRLSLPYPGSTLDILATQTHAEHLSRTVRSNTSVHRYKVIRENNIEASPRVIYVVTPTYVRATQQPDLTRLSQSLMLVPRMHWIVIEDSRNRTEFVSDLLGRMPFPCTHLNARTSSREIKLRVRGCSQRNAALDWILASNISNGVLYFADDDNAFDVRLFDELRDSSKIGLVPTGNMRQTGVGTPVVKHGKVVAFYGWSGGRKWPVEMASFAINIQFWRERGAPKFYPTRKAYIETQFLEAMNITYGDLEPKADNCTRILVWHTSTKAVTFKRPTIKREFNSTNMELLAKRLVFN